MMEFGPKINRRRQVFISFENDKFVVFNKKTEFLKPSIGHQSLIHRFLMIINTCKTIAVMVVLPWLPAITTWFCSGIVGNQFGVGKKWHPHFVQPTVRDCLFWHAFPQ